MNEYGKYWRTTLDISTRLRIPYAATRFQIRWKNIKYQVSRGIVSLNVEKCLTIDRVK